MEGTAIFLFGTTFIFRATCLMVQETIWVQFAVLSSDLLSRRNIKHCRRLPNWHSLWVNLIMEISSPEVYSFVLNANVYMWYRTTKTYVTWRSIYNPFFLLSQISPGLGERKKKMASWSRHWGHHTSCFGFVSFCRVLRESFELSLPHLASLAWWFGCGEKKWWFERVLKACDSLSNWTP